MSSPRPNFENETFSSAMKRKNAVAVRELRKARGKIPPEKYMALKRN
jgi:hypothetical protein